MLSIIRGSYVIILWAFTKNYALLATHVAFRGFVKQLVRQMNQMSMKMNRRIPKKIFNFEKGRLERRIRRRRLGQSA